MPWTPLPLPHIGGSGTPAPTPRRWEWNEPVPTALIFPPSFFVPSTPPRGTSPPGPGRRPGAAERVAGPKEIGAQLMVNLFEEYLKDPERPRTGPRRMGVRALPKGRDKTRARHGERSTGTIEA